MPQCRSSKTSARPRLPGNAESPASRPGISPASRVHLSVPMCLRPLRPPRPRSISPRRSISSMSSYALSSHRSADRWPCTATALDDALRRTVALLVWVGALRLSIRCFVEVAGDGGHQFVGFFVFGDAAHQNHQDERPFCEDNRRVVVDLCNIAGLVGYSRARRQAGWNRFVEPFALYDRNHLLA